MAVESIVAVLRVLLSGWQCVTNRCSARQSCEERSRVWNGGAWEETANEWCALDGNLSHFPHRNTIDKDDLFNVICGMDVCKRGPPPLSLGRGSYLSAHAQAWCAMKRARLSEVDSVCMRSTNI